MTEQKFTTTTSALKDVFKSLARFKLNNTSYPILSSLMIDGDQLILNNRDMEIVVNCGVTNKLNSPVCVNYKAIKSLLRHIYSEEVDLVADGDGVRLRFNGASYGLPAYNADEFPRMKFTQKNKSNIGNAGIVEAMKAVRFAFSDEITRYYLNGVCFSEDEDGNGLLVATNGHVMAIKPIAFMPKGALGKIVPTEVVDYMLANKVTPTTSAFNENMAQFKYAGAMLTAKLIDGVFPDWTMVVPKNQVPRFTVPVKNLMAALKRINCVSSINNMGGVHIIGSDVGALSLTGGVGVKFNEMVDAEIHANNTEIGFNSKYLMWICAAFKDCDTITVSWADVEGMPRTTISGEGSDLRVVLMPMRV